MQKLPRNGKLTVQLYENTLTGKKDEYVGKIIQRGLVTMKDLAELLVNTGDAEDSEKVLKLSTKIAEAALACVTDGFTVRLDLCTLRPSISGVFIGPNASYNPQLHTIGVSYSPSSLARQALKKAIVIITGLASATMVINRVLDVKSGEENNLLTCGRSLKIFGNRLTLDGTDPSVGVWFIHANDEQKRIRVDSSDVVDNYQSQLTVVVPDLEPGEWYIEVVTQSTPNKRRKLKEARSYRFELPLAVL